MKIHLVTYEAEHGTVIHSAWREKDAARRAATNHAIEHHPEHEQHKWHHDGTELESFTPNGDSVAYSIESVTLAD